jgi:hypothetical protein
VVDKPMDGKEAEMALVLGLALELEALTMKAMV